MRLVVPLQSILKAEKLSSATSSTTIIIELNFQCEIKIRPRPHQGVIGLTGAQQNDAVASEREESFGHILASIMNREEVILLWSADIITGDFIHIISN